MSESFNPHGTTILGVRRKGVVAIGGDGQVTLGTTVMKGNARKVRPLGEPLTTHRLSRSAAKSICRNSPETGTGGNDQWSAAMM